MAVVVILVSGLLGAFAGLAQLVIFGSSFSSAVVTYFVTAGATSLLVGLAASTARRSNEGRDSDVINDANDLEAWQDWAFEEALIAQRVERLVDDQDDDRKTA